MVDNFFALNTQDFAYPQQSAELVWRVIDLHESLDVPIDISLTTTMVDLYEAQYMDLLRRLFTSPVVCLGYHGRPPLPYHTDFDWLGMAQMSSEQQRSTIYTYETHPSLWGSRCTTTISLPKTRRGPRSISPEAHDRARRVNSRDWLQQLGGRS